MNKRLKIGEPVDIVITSGQLTRMIVSERVEALPLDAGSGCVSIYHTGWQVFATPDSGTYYLKNQFDESLPIYKLK